MDRLDQLRREIDTLNQEILALVDERARVVREMVGYKREHAVAAYDPTREESMIRDLLRDRRGPLLASDLRAIFSAIFRASLNLQQREMAGGALHEGDVARVRVADVEFGGDRPVLIFGPCSVESEEQVNAVAALRDRVDAPAVLRGGTYKPRTRADSFQGLREEGVDLLVEAGRRSGLPVVTEILDVSNLETVKDRVDMIQVGTRSMYNTELLKALGALRVPVLLKRGFMASVDEVVAAAGYLRAGGNHNIVLCERGIRTFDYRTRNTLDIASVPIMRAELGLPVVVDVSHAVGRTDILLPCARAALAAGADGLMFEVHPDPLTALSDADQQLAPEEFLGILDALDPSARRDAAEAHG